MQLTAILMANAVAFMEPLDLNPRAAISFADIAKALVARYKFQKVPQKPEEFDQTKGVTFGDGQFDNVSIETLAIYAHGIALNTRSSTEDSKRLLEEALQWGSKELGLTYKPSMISRWQYGSQLTFTSKVPLTGIHPAFQELADALSKATGDIIRENLKYELVALVVDHDPLLRKFPLGRFSIQRRESEPFSQDKYFSDAPVPTDMHIRLLEQFEASISPRENAAPRTL